MSRDVIFDETNLQQKMISLSEDQLNIGDIKYIITNSEKEPNSINESVNEQSDVEQIQNEKDVQEDITIEQPRRSERHNKGVPPSKLHIEYVHKACSEDIVEPLTWSDAMSCNESKQWKIAAEEEIKSLMDNKSWNLLKLPDNRKAIGCKWVFKLKRDTDGKINRYKARLVAKGFSQKEDIDYNETFAPVAKYSSIRIILSIAATMNMNIIQLDVKTAFLYGKLNEEIYMQQPEGFITEGKEAFVCKLNKSIYGLK